MFTWNIESNPLPVEIVAKAKKFSSSCSIVKETGMVVVFYSADSLFLWAA